MKTRILTGLVMLVVFVPLLVVDELFLLFQLLMIGLVVGATHEMIKLYESKIKFPTPAKITIFVSTILVFLSLLSEWFVIMELTDTFLGFYQLNLLNIRVGFSAVLIIISLVMFSMIVFDENFDGGSIGRAFTILMLIGLSFGAITILRFNGIRFIVYLFMITVLTDVFAYFIGMTFGKHKMAPKISPKKSWEGAIGGTIVATTVVTLFAFFYTDVHYLFFQEELQGSLFHPIIPETLADGLKFLLIFFITLLTSIMGQIGDLIASRLKRNYDIKDFGNIFPGHGGIIDRFDSAMIASMFLLSILVILIQIFG